ncbi:hypothetical protein [Massilia sp. Leaf139]|uniref:hypothetical protein n=1 Tax=Massilia sp. Leaf139 TaxID=1736272 RepID=UPI0006F8A7C7|nr:hypothetical protein [Massilia sp. Leaf139]KQQ88947.1 hypothetical protein ASF77_09550 [Massilia sp. Leaf139]
MSDKYFEMPPIPPAFAPAAPQDAMRRARLVERYNDLVGKPGKIRRTIQKQFLIGFMSDDELASLHGLYRCVIDAIESAKGLQSAG